MNTFNELVKIIRTEKGFSQKELAKISELDRTTISRIEGDNDYSPTLETAERISNALGINISTMLNLRYVSNRELDVQHFLEDGTFDFLNLTFSKLNKVINYFYILCDLLSIHSDRYEVGEFYSKDFYIDDLIYLNLILKRSMKQILNRDYEFNYENEVPILISKTRGISEHIILFNNSIGEVELPIQKNKDYLIFHFSSGNDSNKKITINKICLGNFSNNEIHFQFISDNKKIFEMFNIIYNDHDGYLDN